jgi:flagellar M-ring protein FliF
MAYLNQIRELFLRLTMRQRILLGVAAAVVVASIYGFIHWQTERNFKPLFEELSAEDAGTVLARLKESGVEVRLENGGKVIKVPANRIDELRIQMASAGLPKTGRMGFELFDKPNFGTSEFAEQVNYHRAVEGELERTIMSLQEVESSRVHITFPRQSLFLENRQPAKASIVLKLRTGAELSRQNVQAIAHLASNAVEGLAPENVSILDMRGNLLSRPGAAGGVDEQHTKQLVEYRERLEKDLREKIHATLEPLLGPDAFRTAVSLECDLSSGDQSEESFDPNRSVMVNSQRSEDGSAPAAATGVPGTPSNLPRPTSRPGTGAGSSMYRRSENTTFQTSRVIRHIQFPQGQVKRLSVSVLLDHSVRMANGKRIVEAPPAERLRAIKDIVSAAVGFQQDRGDQIIVEALPFESTRTPEPAALVADNTGRPRLQLPAAIPAWLRVPLEGHLNWLIGQNWLPAVVIVLALVLLYVLYRLVRAIGSRVGRLFGRVFGVIGAKLPFGKKKGTHVDVTLEPAIEAGGGHAQIESGDQLVKQAAKTLEEQLRERHQQQEKLTKEAIAQLDLPEATVRRADVLNRHIVDLIEQDPAAVANLIRTWTESGNN